MGDFKVVRMVYGKGDNAKQKFEFIPDSGMNDVIARWHAKEVDREFTVASPSSLTTCPRVIWLSVHGVKPTNVMGWGTKQRMLLGRQLEDLFAKQLESDGKLLHHWKDNPGDIVEKFKMGEGLTQIEGVPDYLLDLDGTIVTSDAKTSRSDSYGYVEINQPDVWNDWGWYKYKLQVETYHHLLLANKDWFTEKGLPLPTKCHLFSYALDDGIVKREFIWKPDIPISIIENYAKRFNAALTAEKCPPCTCEDTYDSFDMKFCRYGSVPSNSKVATSCCGEELING